MKKILAELFAALLVFVLTLFLTDLYIARKAEYNANTLCSHEIEEFSNDFTENLRLTRNSVFSFLTGNFSIRPDSLNKTFGKQFYVSDETLSTLKSSMARNMRDFLTTNSKVHCAVFIFDEELGKRYSQYGYQTNEGRGTAIIVARNDSLTHDITDYDYTHAASFSQVKRTHDILWTLPSKSSIIHDKAVIFYVPIFCQDGSFFGAFAINLDIQQMEDNLAKHLPYGKDNSSMVVYNDEGRIIISYPSEYAKYSTFEHFQKAIVENEKYDLETEYDHHIFRYSQGDYYLYQHDIKVTKWHVLISINADAIFKPLMHIRTVTMATSLLGLLMMVFCGFVIFMHMRSNMRQRVIAEDELRMAANVQTSILRPMSFSTPGMALSAYMRPAKKAGGDLYDYAQKDNKFIFCIGDVSGKGMPAALFMTQVVSLFRSAVRTTTDPATIISLINNVLADNNPEMTFCTLFVGVLDGSHLTFCNAGHNPIVKISSIAEQQTESLQANIAQKADFMKERSHTAVGLVEEFPYRSEELNLQRGDTLVLYSDGVTEAMNAQRNQFGNKRLLSVLNDIVAAIPVSEEATPASIVSTITKRLTDTVDNFVGKAEQSDDITIVSIRI